MVVARREKEPWSHGCRDHAAENSPESADIAIFVGLMPMSGADQQDFGSWLVEAGACAGGRRAFLLFGSRDGRLSVLSSIRRRKAENCGEVAARTALAPQRNSRPAKN